MSAHGCDCETHRAERYPETFPDCPIHVGCDDWCGALNEPVTYAEYIAAYGHWRDHVYLGGCSHGT